MKTSWVNGLELPQQEEMRREYDASLLLRMRMLQLCKDKIETSRTACRQKLSYDSPSWAYLQADAVGYERALEEIISLIS